MMALFTTYLRLINVLTFPEHIALFLILLWPEVPGRARDMFAVVVVLSEEPCTGRLQQQKCDIWAGLWPQQLFSDGTGCEYLMSTSLGRSRIWPRGSPRVFLLQTDLVIFLKETESFTFWLPCQITSYKGGHTYQRVKDSPGGWGLTGIGDRSEMSRVGAQFVVHW